MEVPTANGDDRAPGESESQEDHSAQVTGFEQGKRSGGPADLKPPARATARQATVMPILKGKRWTRGKWAAKAGVGKNSVYEYLDGKRRLSTANRKAMAEVLGLTPEGLPD